MKPIVALITSCFITAGYAQTAPPDKGISINAGVKLLEITRGNLPAAELKLIRFNNSKLISPYLGFAGGRIGYKEPGRFETWTEALSIKGGGLLRLPFTDNGKDRVFLRAGIGYIMRNQKLSIAFENEHWGNRWVDYKQGSNNWFMDLGLRSEIGIGNKFTFNLDFAGYIIGNNIEQQPFASQIAYRQKINFYSPNPGLGSGTSYGFNLTVGFGFLIR